MGNQEIIATNKAVDTLPKIKPRLQVHSVAALLQKEYTQTQIAEVFGISKQAVSSFLKRNSQAVYDILQPDDYHAKKWMSVMHRCLDSADDKKASKASLQQCVTSGAIAAEKSRLFSNQSTENIAVDAVLQDIHKDLFKTKVKSKVMGSDVEDEG